MSSLLIQLARVHLGQWFSTHESELVISAVGFAADGLTIRLGTESIYYRSGLHLRISEISGLKRAGQAAEAPNLNPRMVGVTPIGTATYTPREEYKAFEEKHWDCAKRDGQVKVDLTVTSAVFRHLTAQCMLGVQPRGSVLMWISSPAFVTEEVGFATEWDIAKSQTAPVVQCSVTAKFPEGVELAVSPR